MARVRARNVALVGEKVTLVARRSADPRMATMMRRALARWGASTTA